MQPGWVYVLVNSSMPGLAKVGRTVRAPADRVAELSGATGVATPFVLAFDQAFADCCAAEKAVHHELDRRGLRVSSNREFFRGPPSEIIRVVLETADQRLPRNAMDGASAEWLLATGDNCLQGAGDRLQDTAEAARFYKQAAARGSAAAYERLGRVYAGLYAARGEATARRRAMDHLREGVRRGDHYCYAEMATLFACERNVASFNKAWELFFAAEGEAANADSPRLERACCRYVAGSLTLGMQPGYPDQVGRCAHGLIRLLLRELDQVRGDSPARASVVATLRWVRQCALSHQAQHMACPPSLASRPSVLSWTGRAPSGPVHPIDNGQLAFYGGA